MNANSIIFLPAATGLSAHWRKLRPAGEAPERGILAPDDNAPMVADWVTVAPAEDVAVRWLILPKVTALQQVAAARWQMSKLLGHDLADDEVILGRTSIGGTTPVAVVRRSLLAAWKNWIDGAGLSGTSLVPAQLCVPLLDGVMHAVRMETGDVLVSAIDLSTIVSSEWLETIADGRAVQWTEADQALDTLSDGAVSCPLNLLSSAVTNSRQTLGLKQICVLAFVLVLSPAWVGLAHIAHDKWAGHKVDAEAKAKAVAFMPDLAQQKDALKQAEQRLADQPPLGNHAKTIAALTTVIETRTGTTLSEVTGTGGKVRGVLRLGGSEDAAVIRDALVRYGLDFQNCTPTSEDGQTVCAFTIGALQ